MKKELSVICLALATSLASCGGGGSSDNGIRNKNSDFKAVVSIPDSAIALQSIISIDGWNLGDSALVCQSDNTDRIFYIFDLDNFQTVDSFGVIGQGPGEFISPHLMKSANKKTIVADSQTRIFTEFKGGEKSEIVCPDKWALFNQLCDVNYPIISSYELGRDNEGREVLKWGIMDVTTGEKIDSINFNAHDESDPDVRLFLKTATNGQYIVFVNIPKDEFQIAKVSSDGKVTERTVYKGSDALSPESPYYVDVVCGKEYFYLLSEKNAKFSRQDGLSGNSDIEIYDYAGNPVAQLKLDIISISMLLDEDRGRLLLTSPLDEDIHIVQLPEL